VLVNFIPEIQKPEPAKNVYRKKDVFPLIATHYINMADGLLGMEETPDFAEIKLRLKIALTYATDDITRKKVQDRLKNINFFVSLYKGDTAAQKNTIEELESALTYYNEAVLTGLSEKETGDIKQKMESVSKRLELLKAEAENMEADAAGAFVKVVEDKPSTDEE